MANVQFTALSNAAKKKVYECYCKGDTPRILLINPKFLLYAKLAAPINNLSSVPMAIGSGAAATSQAQAETFKASGAAAAFIRFCLLFLRYSWSRRSSSAWSFSAAGKGLGHAAMSGLNIL
jgi:hypothetical protein